ncbi:hypothetical protein O4214_30220 [Rhodococcus erythropolis]|uniref:hypothetical protein n=1 Tax=Rhodococcus erythropolis TaxID=1833 RepID=UPI001E2CE718|nr:MULTISPECIES: hypothetical protein [Rhodococcus erythropolis group]MCD2109341.1 hypothetical protein [Rhodococcus qingshengii]MCZ4528266.1 hypothetical protein [Rhodococcus erythropolis]
MAEFQCTLPINYRRKITSTESSPRGNQVEKHADSEPKFVHLWYTSDEAAPSDGHSQREAIDATCYPPTTLGVKPGDLIELPGEGWLKVVKVGNYDNNDYFVPGIVDVKLRRVDG